MAACQTAIYTDTANIPYLPTQPIVSHFSSTKTLDNTWIKPILKINNDIVDFAPTYKYLGMTLDNKLTFKKHIDIVEKSIDYKTYLFRHARKNMTEKAAVGVLKTMILPVPDYGDICYMVAIKTHIVKLQNAVNKGLRTALCHRGTINTEKLLKVAELNYMEDRREQHFSHKAFLQSLNINLIDRRPIRTRAHDERLLRVTRPLNPMYRKSAEYRLSMRWNSFEKETRSITNEMQFKQWNDGIYKEKIKAFPDIPRV